jgi:hypothetical protein
MIYQEFLNLGVVNIEALWRFLLISKQTFEESEHGDILARGARHFRLSRAVLSARTFLFKQARNLRQECVGSEAFL